MTVSGVAESTVEVAAGPAAAAGGELISNSDDDG